MKLIWHVTSDDIRKVRLFFEERRDNPFVKGRIATNLCADKPRITKEEFWAEMVGCLLSTQQRSGPASAVSRFLSTTPFPLSWGICCEQKDLANFVTKILSAFGGLRRSTKIGKELAANYDFLESGGWERTVKHLEVVRQGSSPATERMAAEFIDDHFRGFGPKQSRNLLQGLGLSKYEIPIDSRITKWLNKFGFPIKLSAAALGDRNYYNLISDGIQQLAIACEIMPCVLDAAIFSSFDGDGWTEENVVW